MVVTTSDEMSWFTESQTKIEEFQQLLQTELQVNKKRLKTLEINYLSSEFHTVAPLMSWEFVRWGDAKEMIFQLTFDKPTIVSMEIPNDEIQVLFFDESLFAATNGKYIYQGY